MVRLYNYRAVVCSRFTTWGTFYTAFAEDKTGYIISIDCGMLCGYTMPEIRQIIHAKLDEAGIPRGKKLRWL